MTETPTPSLTPTETETPTETPTLTPEPLPGATETATELLTATESPTPVLTETPTASGTTTETLTPTASATFTPTATALPSGPLGPQFADTFDDPAYTAAHWALGPGWMAVPYDSGLALGIMGGETPVTWLHTASAAAANIRVLFSAGEFRLSALQSEAGAYTAALDAAGRVTLYRNEAALATAETGTLPAGWWRELGLYAENGDLRVAVDGAVVLTALDPAPLPPGTISFAGRNLGGTALVVDDISVWLPTPAGGMISPLSVIVDEQSIYWDYNEADYGGWYSGAPATAGLWDAGSPFYVSAWLDQPLRCESQSLGTVADNIGLIGLGWNDVTVECPNGYILNSIYDLGQTRLFNHVFYRAWITWEGIGRRYGFVLYDEYFNRVYAHVPTIAGWGEQLGLHDFTDWAHTGPIAARYIQLISITGNSGSVLFDWVHLAFADSVPLTPTPSPIPEPFTVALTVESGIPYQHRQFTLTITNNTAANITDLNISLFPFTSSPDLIPFTEMEQHVPFRTPGSSQLLVNDYNHTAHQEDISINAGETWEIEFSGHSKRSGERAIDVTLVSLAQSITMTTQVSVTTELTNLDLSDYSTMIFWAIFNETSEGNEFLHDPENYQNCFQQGWTPDGGAEILWTVHRDDPIASPRCRDLLYMDVQTMLNGILNYERANSNRASPGAYQYFTINYKGSLGNQPLRSSGSYYRGEDDDPYVGSNILWMEDQCWPLASDLGITGVPAMTIGYKAVLDPNQTIIPLPEDFDREAAVIEWLQRYLACYMESGVSIDARQEWQYNFFQQVYLDSEGAISNAIEDLSAHCPVSEASNLDSYLNCDPTNGGFGRVSATGSDSRPITTPVDVCQGLTPAEVLGSNVDFLTPFRQEMAAIGSPGYPGGVFPGNGYRPAYSTFILPVVHFDRDLRNSSSYSVLSCYWGTISYPQPATPYNYPR